jgi:hypothetical protein
MMSGENPRLASDRMHEKGNSLYRRLNRALAGVVGIGFLLAGLIAFAGIFGFDNLPPGFSTTAFLFCMTGGLWVLAQVLWSDTFPEKGVLWDPIRWLCLVGFLAWCFLTMIARWNEWVLVLGVLPLAAYHLRGAWRLKNERPRNAR